MRNENRIRDLLSLLSFHHVSFTYNSEYVELLTSNPLLLLLCLCFFPVLVNCVFYAFFFVFMDEFPFPFIFKASDLATYLMHFHATFTKAAITANNNRGLNV